MPVTIRPLAGSGSGGGEKGIARPGTPGETSQLQIVINWGLVTDQWEITYTVETFIIAIKIIFFIIIISIKPSETYAEHPRRAR